MDAVLQALITAAPQLGVAGVLLTILGLLLRQAGQDRSDYRTSLAEAAKRHSSELSDREKRYNEDISDLQREVDKLRARIDQLETELDLEREARRKAEDMAAQALRGRRRPAS